MQTIGMETFGGREVLKKLEIPKPDPKPDEVLIKIKAAGVNPVDWKIREGLLKERLPHEFPITLGWDAAGVIEAIGSEIKEYEKGDEVFAYARKEVVHDGTYGEYITLTPAHLAPKPKNLTFEEAAAVPLAALTAYQALFESIGLKKDEIILIHAGAGGVGGYAIQMAKEAGAQVITTASPNHHNYVKELGADWVIDYNREDFSERIRQKYVDGIPACFDTVGEATQIKSCQVLEAGGRLTSILAIQEPVQKNTAIRVGYVFVRPEPAHLKMIGEKIEAGKLKVHLAATYPVAQAAQAHELIEGRHVAGKIVLTV